MIVAFTDKVNVIMTHMNLILSKVLELVANHLKESNQQGSTYQRVESGEMSALTTSELLISLPGLISRDLE